MAIIRATLALCILLAVTAIYKNHMIVLVLTAITTSIILFKVNINCLFGLHTYSSYFILLTRAFRENNNKFIEKHHGLLSGENMSEKDLLATRCVHCPHTIGADTPTDWGDMKKRLEE